MYLRLFALATLVGSSALAQIDWAGFASGLRSKYGAPLLRETFRPMPGVEMVVDYAANGNVCRIQLPPMAPEHGSNVQSVHAMHEFLMELIPGSLRGKELRSGAMQAGLLSINFTEYENVTISESSNNTGRTGVAVTFPKEQCRDQVQ